MAQDLTQNLDQLESKKLFELRSMANQLGLGWEKTDTKEDLLRRVRERVLTQQKDDPKLDTKAPVKIIPIHDNTPEQVREAIAKFAGKGLEIKFEEGCWHFRYRGAEDSGTLKMPLSMIVKRAEYVARGARNPKKFKDGGMAGALM